MRLVLLGTVGSAEYLKVTVPAPWSVVRAGEVDPCEGEGGHTCLVVQPGQNVVVRSTDPNAPPSNVIVEEVDENATCP